MDHPDSLRPFVLAFKWHQNPGAEPGLYPWSIGRWIGWNNNIKDYDKEHFVFDGAFKLYKFGGD